MGLRDAYKTAHPNTAVAQPTAPTRSIKINQADFGKVSDALEAQFPTIQPKSEPVQGTDFVGVVPDPNGNKNLGQAILYKGGSLVLTGVCLDFKWPA